MAATTADALTPEQARTELADAQRERAEAQQLADALAEQIRSGDATVKPSDLAAARDLAEFADLRIEAARRRVTAAEDADRHARARQIGDSVRAATAADQTEAVTTAVRRVVDAVAALHSLVDDRNAQIRDLSQAADAIADELTAHGVDPRTVRTTYGITGGSGSTGGRAVADHTSGVRLHEVHPVRAVVGAVALALTAREAAMLRTAATEDGSTGALFAAFPATADAFRYSAEEFAALPAEQRHTAHRFHRAPAPEQGAA